MTATKGYSVGFSYNQKRISVETGVASEAEAEFDTPATLQAIRTALSSLGHNVVDLEAVPQLPKVLVGAEIDVVFNIAEGIRGRNREVQVPALLDLMGIPYTGSDPTTLAIAFDKGLAKRVASTQGVQTAPFQLLIRGNEKLDSSLKFPLIVKPVAEGSSKGVQSQAVVVNEAELREMSWTLIKRFRQPVIAEEFLSGREFTVALLGSSRQPKVLPIMEIVFEQKTGEFDVYSYEHKIGSLKGVRNETSPKVSDSLKSAIEKMAIGVYQALGCRDVARIDIRLNSKGEPCFIECNPLPGLSPGWSDLCLIAEANGMSYSGLIGEILAPALRRMKAQHPERYS